jgi:hypothetical protein
VVVGNASTVRLFADGSELGSQTNTSFTISGPAASVSSGCLSIGGEAAQTCGTTGWTGALSPTELFQGSLAQVSCCVEASLAKNVAVIAAADGGACLLGRRCHCTTVAPRSPLQSRHAY